MNFVDGGYAWGLAEATKLVVFGGKQALQIRKDRSCDNNTVRRTNIVWGATSL